VSELSEIGAFIAEVGFPIFVALVLMYTVVYMHRENRRDLGNATADLAEIKRLLKAMAGRRRRPSRRRSSDLAR
jgi:hypothetical protein